MHAAAKGEAIPGVSVADACTSRTRTQNPTEPHGTRTA